TLPAGATPPRHRRGPSFHFRANTYNSFSGRSQSGAPTPLCERPLNEGTYMAIDTIHAREILDSRGNPTAQAEAVLADASGAAPPRARRGARAPRNLGAAADKRRSRGGGAPRPVRKGEEETAPRLSGHDSREQAAIDALLLELDGTPNKAKLGANAMLGVSLAVAHAAADSVELPLYRYLGGTNARYLPVPMMNVINGGKHADNTIDFQEFMILPIGAPSFREALRLGTEVYHALKGVLHDKGLSTSGGDEGGFAPNLKSAEEALDVLSKAVQKAGYKLREQVAFTLDPATTELYEEAKAKGKT